MAKLGIEVVMTRYPSGNYGVVMTQDGFDDIHLGESSTDIATAHQSALDQLTQVLFNVKTLPLAELKETGRVSLGMHSEDEAKLKEPWRHE